VSGLLRRWRNRLLLAGRYGVAVRTRGRHPRPLSIEDRGWLESAPVLGDDAGIEAKVDEFMAFRRTLYVSGACRSVSRELKTVFVVFGDSIHRFAFPGRPGRDVPFKFETEIPVSQGSPDIMLGFEYADGARALVREPFRDIWTADPYHRSFSAFTAEVGRMREGHVLEIGSRARSGNVYRDFIPASVRYTGIDIKEGPNVDVVGDAHALSAYFAPATFDAAYSVAVFEHLLMPWKAAVELNRVMKPGGLVFISTHQSFPLHEQPWDFWRYSNTAWHGIFNKYTGFRIEDAVMGERVYLVGSFLSGLTYGLDEQPAFMASTVLCRKVGDAVLDWPADLGEVVQSIYPH
jgi:SAM-dependent methyltransferase